LSVVRTITLSAASLFVGLSAMFVVTGTATAASHSFSAECVEDWHTPCP
jgi:hypothetical protein